MEIDLIYTFDQLEQRFETVSVTTDKLKDEQTLKDFVTNLITPKEREELIKVSCCLIQQEGDADFVVPEWYMSAWGKLWFN